MPTLDGVLPKSVENKWDIRDLVAEGLNSLNLSNGTYQIKQIGAGVYVLQGVDNRGHHVDSVETDSDILEEDFLEAAQKIDRSSGEPVRREGSFQ